MKFLGSFIILMAFVLSVNSVNAISPLDSQMIYDFSEIILIGNVTSTNSTFSPTHILYQIHVEKYLKNEVSSDELLASGQNTVFSRLGNQVFNPGDRVLFFLNNETIGYDRYNGILGVLPESRLIEPQWDSCNIFEENIPREHWFLGGKGPIPKIQQGNNSDNENFKTGKLITVTYDVSNLSDTIQDFDLDGITMISNGTTLEVMSTMNQHIILEPCTPYETIEWRFTPGMEGTYTFEIKDPRSGNYGLGFIVKDSDATVIDLPLKQFKSGIPAEEIKCKENLIIILKKNGNPACVKPATKTKLIERGWVMLSLPPKEIPFGIEIPQSKNLTMEVISSDWCSGLSLDKIPPNGLTKRNDWFGANSLIMKIEEPELSQVPHLKDMINEMKNTTGFKPHEFDENVMVKQISGSGVDHSKIFNWLKENFEKQYAPRGDGSFSSFFQYNGDTYVIHFTQC